MKRIMNSASSLTSSQLKQSEDESEEEFSLDKELLEVHRRSPLLTEQNNRHREFLKELIGGVYYDFLEKVIPHWSRSFLEKVTPMMAVSSSSRQQCMMSSLDCVLVFDYLWLLLE